jgi:hypothetical protein
MANPDLFNSLLINVGTYTENETRRKVQFSSLERVILIITFAWARRSLVRKQENNADMQTLSLAREYLTLAGNTTLLEKLDKQSATTTLRMVGERKSNDRNYLLIDSILQSTGYHAANISLVDALLWLKNQRSYLAEQTEELYDAFAAMVRLTQADRPGDWDFHKFKAAFQLTLEMEFTTLLDFFTNLYHPPVEPTPLCEASTINTTQEAGSTVHGTSYAALKEKVPSEDYRLLVRDESSVLKKQTNSAARVGAVLFAVAAVVCVIVYLAQHGYFS